MESHPGGGLHARVLVLNKLYMPLRIVSARHAMRYLVKTSAEVLDVEDGSYRNYDFPTWLGMWTRPIHGNGNGHAGESGNGNGNGGLHDWIRGFRFELRAPRIIRLVDYGGMPVRRVRPTRRNIFVRDDLHCQYCGKRFPVRRLTVDHVVPRSRGGGDTWLNLVSACLVCNDRKGDRSPTEAGLKLRQPPVEPTAHPEFALRLKDERYRTWQPFLGQDAG